MRITTWNVNSLKTRLAHVLRFMAEQKPDVLCLQETKTVDAGFPADELAAAGYVHQLIRGQPTYNGVAILSKHPLEQTTSNFTFAPTDEQARLVSAVIAGVRVVDVYVPNGHEVGSDKYAYKLDWLARLRAEIDGLGGEQLLVCGDMNIAPADGDTHDPFAAEGQLLCSKAERDALLHLQAAGLTDVWRHRNPFATEFSWWDYRASGFRKNHGFRIDHHLASQALLARVKGVKIHRDVRGWDQPSDHAPVSLDLKE
jgi:exodeoxyribonuclease-3